MAPDIVDPVVISKQSNTDDRTAEVIDQKTANGLHNRKPTVNNGDGVPELYDKHGDTNTINCNSSDKKISADFQPQIRWPDLIVQIFLHTGAVYGLCFLLWTIRFYTFLWCKYYFILIANLKLKTNFNEFMQAHYAYSIFYYIIYK